MTSILETIPYYSEVKVKLKSWYAPEKSDARHLRGTLMGIIITITIGEVGIYKMVQQNIRKGDLPNYTADVLIILTSILEAVLGPFVSWYGFKNRRSTLIGWILALIVISVSWYALPLVTIIDAAQKCDQTYTFSGFTSESLTRLTILSLSCIVFSLTRVVLNAHGIAYLDQEEPDKISSHYGILVAARILPLLLADRLATGGIDDKTGSHIGGLVFGCVINFIQIPMSMPKENVTKKGENTTATGSVEKLEEEKNVTEYNQEERKLLEEVDDNNEDLEMKEEAKTSKSDKIQEHEVDRDFVTSLKRLFRNKLALYQMVSMGLLAAALWGFAFHHDEIVKAKYYINPRRSSTESTTGFLRHIFVIISVLYASTFYDTLKLTKETLKRAKDIAIVMSGIACLIYYVIVSSGDCRKGLVAGLSLDVFTPAVCRDVRCTPRWREFSPVCVPDSMFTFFSMREAGCQGSHDFDGVSFYINCACSGTTFAKTALEGACSDAFCNPPYYFHLMLYLLIVITTVISLQAQGIFILRAVDPRDKSLAMGMAGSYVAVFASAVGHLIYNTILSNTCLWFEDERCHLQTEQFPRLVGWSSGALAMLSAASSALAWAHRDSTGEHTDTTGGPAASCEKKIN